MLLVQLPGRRYFIFIFIIGAAVFITFSAVIYRHYDNAQLLNEYALHDYEIMRQGRLVLFHSTNMETSVRGYMLTGRKQFLEPYERAIAQLPDAIASLRLLTQNEPEEWEKISLWLQHLGKYQTMMVLQIKGYRPGSKNTFSVATLEQQKQQMDILRSAIESYNEDRIQKLQARTAAARSEQINFVRILLLGTVLAIGAMLLTTIIVLSLISRAQREGLRVAQAEERFRLVMNGINDAVYDYNAQDNSVYYSPAFHTMLGYSTEEFKHSVPAFNELMHPDDKDAAWDMFYRYARREVDHYTNMFRLKHKDGSWRWLMSRGVGFWDDNGRLTRLIGTHMDITEHKKREDDLAQANSDLETFTYITSHDLRSPLVNLKGFANELRFAMDRINPVIQPLLPALSPEEQSILREALDDTIPEALKFIEKSTDRMDTLTSAVLDLTRIGKREFHSELVDVEAIIEKCLNAQAFEITRKNAEVSYGTLPEIMSDSLALEQIFSNLLDNAIKYLDPARQGKIVVSGRETAADVIYSVQDNGRGIAQVDQHKVFEMFRRARNTDDVRGAGIGMSFVRATVRKLGGAIWYNSALNEGTTFYVRLPKKGIQS